MKLTSLNLLLTGLLAVFLISCSSKSSIPVPEDAGFVLHIDGASLSAKLPWDEIKQSELFKTAIEEANDSIVIKLLNNPEESGINIYTDTYLFTKTTSKGGYTAIVCSLKDAAKFESFLKEVMKEKKIETKNGISFIASTDNIITWKKDRLVFIGDTPDVNSSMDGDSRESFKADSLFQFALEVYDMKKSKSLGNNSKFSSLLKDKGDLHLWVNAESLTGGVLPAVLAITKANLLFKGNISTASINFEDGKVTFKGKNYFSKEITALYKKFSPKDFDEALLQKIPAGNIDALFAFTYPPEGLKEFITILGVDGLLNIFLAQAGYSIDDFVKANKGEVLLSVSDFKIDKKEVKQSYGDGEDFSYTSEMPSAKILFATTIKDKVAFEKLIGILKETINKESGGGAADEIMKQIPYQLTDKWFVAGNDSSAIYSFGTTNTNHAFISKIKGHPICGYINIQNFINGAKNSFANDSTATAVADKSLQTWEDIIFYGGNFKGGGLETYAEINMVDKKTNSLKQFNQYFGFIATKMRDAEKKRRESYELMDKLDFEH